MSSINNIILSGRIANDAKLYTTKNGKPYIRFTLAVSHYNSATKEEDAQFIPCVMYGDRSANLQNHFTKGLQLLVGGRIDYQTPKQEDGTYKQYFSAVVNDFDFGARPKGNNSIEFKQTQPPASYGEEIQF